MSAGATLSLPISAIGELPADQYVGLIDEDAIACLTARLGAEGLLTPIWVRRNGNAAKSPWSVIAGRHRLRAAMRLGWTEIAAVERADPKSDAAELSRLQLAENLDRRVLRPIERACYIMDRARQIAKTSNLPEPKSQQSQAARVRWDACDKMSHARTLDDEIAASCGCDARTIRRYRRLHSRLVAPFPDLFATLNAHPLGESLSAMTRVAQFLHDHDRRRAIMAVLSRPDWANVEAALVASNMADSKGRRIDPENLHDVLRDTWLKLRLADRRRCVDWLVADVTPGMALDIVAGFKKRGLLP